MGLHDAGQPGATQQVQLLFIVYTVMAMYLKDKQNERRPSWNCYRVFAGLLILAPRVLSTGHPEVTAESNRNEEGRVHNGPVSCKKVGERFGGVHFDLLQLVMLKQERGKAVDAHSTLRWA